MVVDTHAVAAATLDDRDSGTAARCRERIVGPETATAVCSGGVLVMPMAVMPMTGATIDRTTRRGTAGQMAARSVRQRHQRSIQRQHRGEDSGNNTVQTFHMLQLFPGDRTASSELN